MLSQRSELKPSTAELCRGRGRSGIGSERVRMTRTTEDTGFARAQCDTGRSGRAWLVLLLGASFQLGCNGAASAGPNAPGSGITRRDTAVTHEPCDIKSSGTEKIDANNDGKPDIFIVHEGGREVCRAVD